MPGITYNANILLRRGTTHPGTTLDYGEPGIDTCTNILYIGKGIGLNPIIVGTFDSTKIYIDGSLARYVKSASLGNDFYWQSGILEVSTGIGDVTKIYVDGSLAKRDASITQFYNLTKGFDDHQNTYIGEFALDATYNSYNNVAIGYESLKYHTTGSENIAIGYQALKNVVKSLGNTAIGNLSLWDVSAGYSYDPTSSSMLNTAIGYGTFYYLKYGCTNIAIGVQAGSYPGTCIDLQNTILIGTQARPLNNGAINEIVIGPTIGHGSYTITFGGSSYTNTYLYGNINLNNKRIIGIDIPINSSDATNKIYVDSSLNILKTYVNTTFIKEASLHIISGGTY